MLGLERYHDIWDSLRGYRGWELGSEIITVWVWILRFFFNDGIQQHP